MNDIAERPPHATEAKDLLARLESDEARGLSQTEAQARRERFGPNILSERRGHGPLVRFLLQFHQPLVYILLAAATVTGALGEWVDMGVILAVVLVNAIVGHIQESKALEAIAALSRTMTNRATVLRDGVRREVPAAQLVPGDVVFLQSGDRVPADLRLLRVRDLQVDESALTGESVPVSKAVAPLEDDTPLGDRINLCFSSALVTYGTATGVVVSIGDGTEIGRISELIATAESLDTPLGRKIHVFSRMLLVAILVLSGGTFAVAMAQGQGAVDAFMAVVALAVGAIPEGLPAAVTIMLAIGVSRMASQRAVIRRLPAVETLGSTTIVCSDKTGTLTKNEMTVREVSTVADWFEVDGAGYGADGHILREGDPIDVAQYPVLRECLIAGALCNDSRVRQEGDAWRVEGDPTEAALLVAARKGGLSEDDLGRDLPRLDTIPFESQHQYMATLHDAGEGAPRIAYVKGSVEAILQRAASLHGEGTLDAREILAKAERMGDRGLRVLALARKELPEGKADLAHDDVATGLEVLGLQGMMDPPRPEARQAVDACHRAGVDVKMITGDHPATARAIADMLGLARREEVQVITGRELEAMADDTLLERIERTTVFARVSPEHKLRLVRALQERGHVVAMTGDGVNDAPALRRADIGVAMGIAGTEVARDASDMILTDDNFASIEAAVEEGRGVFDNLVKFIVWTLPTNGGEALTIMAAVILGMSLPVLPVQILWVNMTTAVCLGMMLAFEPKEPGIMERPPRVPSEPILTGPIIVRILMVSVLLATAVFGTFQWELAAGADPAQARTAAVGVLVFGELFYLFNCRSLDKSMFTLGMWSNPLLWFGVALMVALQLLFTYVPFMNQLFHTEPPRPEAWILVLGSAVLIYTVVGIEKWTRTRLGREATQRPA
jgi:cation-transporting P-type ATPase F